MIVGESYNIGQWFGLTWREDVVMVTMLDGERIAYHFPKPPVPHGTGHVKLVTAWANASMGQLPLTNIREEWETDAGPVTMSFDLHGVTHCLKPRLYPGIADLEMIDQVSELLPDPASRFLLFGATYIGAGAILLTPEERAALERLNWRFLDGATAMRLVDEGITILEGDEP